MPATFAFRAAGDGAIHPAKIPGQFLEAIIEMAGDASYPTGGYSFTIADIQALTGGQGMVIESVEVIGNWLHATNGVRIATYDAANKKVMAHVLKATPAANDPFPQLANAQSMTGYTCALRVKYR